MNTNTHTDGWTTVRRGGGGWGVASSSRDMPSAFGGGGTRERREDEARRAWDERQRAVAKQREAEAEAARQARISDITNVDEYPPLGGGKICTSAGAKPAVSYSTVTREMAARAATEEAEAADFAKRRAAASASAGAAFTGPRLYRHGTYDDGPVDHDVPDEDGYYPPEDDDAPPYYCDEEEPQASGEFNTHLAVTRRRGDKSDW